MRKLVVIGATVAVALAAVACGSGDDGSSSRADPAPSTNTTSAIPDPCEDHEPLHIDDEPAQDSGAHPPRPLAW